MSFRTLIATLALLATGTAFAPIQQQRSTATKSASALEFGFLKELGLEKPDWLPDFGGKKEEDTPAPAAAEEVSADEEGGEETAAVEE